MNQHFANFIFSPSCNDGMFRMSLQLWTLLFSDYIEFLWEEGESLSCVTDGLSGLQDLRPSLRGCLALSWRLVKTWQKNEMPNRAAPLPEERVTSGSVWSFLPSQAIGHVTWSSGCFLCSFAYRGTPFFASLPDTDKPTARLCCPQSGPHQDFSEERNRRFRNSPVLAPICRALAQWKQSVSPSTFLIPFSPYLFRKHFQDGLERLKLGQWGFRPLQLASWWSHDVFSEEPLL